MVLRLKGLKIPMIYLANMIFYILYSTAFYRSNKIVLELQTQEPLTVEENNRLLKKAVFAPFILISETLSHSFMSKPDMITKYATQMFPPFIFDEEDDLDKHLDSMESKKDNTPPSKLH